MEVNGALEPRRSALEDDFEDEEEKEDEEDAAAALNNLDLERVYYICKRRIMERYNEMN